MSKPIQVNPDIIGSFLEDQAEVANVITYGQIVSRFGLPPLDGNWKSHPLCEIFEILDQQDSVANRPFRTSIVVGVESGSPGPGFFEALERLKNIQDPGTLRGRESLWVAELNATHNHYRPQ